jgi:hypothetical protein
VSGGRNSGSGEPAAPRRQSLLRASRCALLPAATPRDVLPRSERREIIDVRSEDGWQMTLELRALADLAEDEAPLRACAR